MEEGTPHDIDVVLYDRGRGRYPYQIAAVRSRMPWVRCIHVLLANDETVPKNIRPKPDKSTLYYVPFRGTMAAAFVGMPNLKGIATHAMFMGDTTFPASNVPHSYLFARSHRPRMFNWFRDERDQRFFSTYLEETMPAVVTDMGILKGNATLQDALYDLLTEDRAVVRGDLCRDVLVNSEKLSGNAKTQLQNITKFPPIFASIHVSGPRAADANALVLKTLKAMFPNDE